MSLATLKRKTHTKYNNMSVNKPQFSLQGYYRNDRSLPSTNRIQTSLPRTLARGNQLRGYGGTQNTFPIKIISTLCEQPNAEQPQRQQIKLSTKTTSGMIATKYAWTKLPNPFTWVKRQNNAMNTSSQVYTTNLSKEAIKTIISTPGQRPAIINQCNFTKNPYDFVASPQGIYIEGLGGNCVNTIVNTVYDSPNYISATPILGSI